MESRPGRLMLLPTPAALFRRRYGAPEELALNSTPNWALAMVRDAAQTAQIHLRQRNCAQPPRPPARNLKPPGPRQSSICDIDGQKGHSPYRGYWRG